MNDHELDQILNTWEAPEASSALRESVRLGVPAKPHRRSYGWAAAAASIVASASLLGVAMLGTGEARLADGTNIQSSMRVEPASARERWQRLGFAFSTAANRQQAYCYDPSTHTYTGYDLSVAPKGNGKYLVTVQAVSKPFRMVGDSADAADYRAEPLASMPAPREVEEGEPFDIDLIHDPQTGDRVFERVELAHDSAGGFFQHLHTQLNERHMRFALWLNGFLGISDGRLRLNSPKLSINGAQVLQDDGLELTGRGLFFYLPGKGRYVIVLDPRHESRYTRAGSANGNTLEFTLEGNEYRIESQGSIAGSGSHPIWVLHEDSYRVNPERPELGKPFFAAGRPDTNMPAPAKP